MIKSLAACFLILSALVAVAQTPELQTGLALKYLVQLPAITSPHAPLIILLHGYGSDERDLFGLKDEFPKNCLVISARAPYALANGGYQWYEFTSNGPQLDGKKEQLDGDRKLILQFIDEVVRKYNADAKRVYLAGFSQGAIMSYEVALTNPAKVKGIAVLSGRLLPSLQPLIKNTVALKQLRIFIAHGTADNRIPFADGKAACDYLTGLGLKPDFHTYAGMSHTISNDVLRDLRQWLGKDL